MKIKTFIFAIAFFNIGITNAALINNGDFTTDNTTNLDWLDLTFSKGYSYNELLFETSVGGLFEDYSLATVDQVNSLFLSAGLPSIGNETTNFSSVKNLISLIGSTSEQNGFLQSTGITATPGNPFGHKVTGLDFFYDNGKPKYSLIDGLTFGDSFGPSTVGGWLIRESVVVPEPSSLLLLSLGILLSQRKIKV
ncbi:MAG: PEP-CTERM sorting domain-containing protein [Gammaproteobacteria bacterium]|nr:PEP-CTERM sorting domain-containing protein [Gammaproteobacteria bacterium]